MKITGKAGLVTGANRGIGRALVGEALRRSAGHVYAGTRQNAAPVTTEPIAGQGVNNTWRRE